MARKLTSLIALCLLLPIKGVQAQDFDIVDQFRSTLAVVQGGIDDLLDTKILSGTRLKLGFAIGTTPDYSGSNNYSFRALPMITILYKDKWKFENGDFAYNLHTSKKWSFGPTATLNFGRESRQNPVLKGIDDIGDTVDLGVFAKFKSPKTGTLVQAKLRHGLSKGQGMRAELLLGQAIYKKDDFMLIAGIRTKYFSQKTMQTNFGISQEQSEKSDYGFDIFRANAGLSETTLALVAVNDYKKKRVRAMGVISFGRLLGSAADSPLVSGYSPINQPTGSASQLILGTAITYRF